MSSASVSSKSHAKPIAPKLCHHGIPARVAMSTKKSTAGKYFFSCPFWQDKTRACDFFEWETAADEFRTPETQPHFYELVNDKIEDMQKKVELLLEVMEVQGKLKLEIESLAWDVSLVNSAVKSTCLEIKFLLIANVLILSLIVGLMY